MAFPDFSTAAVRRRWLAMAGLVLGGLIVLRVVWRVLLPPAIPTVTVSRQPLVQTVVATGRVRADSRARLGAQVTGVVQRVLVREGDTVAAGTPLIELDDRELSGTAAQARASLAQAQANLQQLRQVRRPVTVATLRQAEVAFQKSEADFKRATSLRESGSVSEEEFDATRQAYEAARSQRDIARAQAAATDTAGADLRIAEAAVAAAQAASQSAQARLAYTRIVAPGRGMVLTRAVEPGDAVQPGRVLMELALEAPAMLSVVPDEKNLASLAVGQFALASADAFPTERFTARTSYISPVVDPAQGTVEVRLTVDSAPAYLRPDMTVSVDIEVARRDTTLVVPLEAVHEPLSAAPWVYVIRDRRLARQTVRLGARGTRFGEVLEGLQEGEAVVPVSNRTAAEGMRARARR
ncbi:MAG TPA: efflux RND transporter periplasmic adaptor subunit [Gemmatimonadales bacterium]